MLRRIPSPDIARTFLWKRAWKRVLCIWPKLGRRYHTDTSSSGLRRHISQAVNKVSDMVAVVQTSGDNSEAEEIKGSLFQCGCIYGDENVAAELRSVLQGVYRHW